MAEFLKFFDLILLPEFDVQRLLKRGRQGELSKKSKSTLAALSHATFRQRLYHVLGKYEGQVLHVSEAQFQVLQQLSALDDVGRSGKFKCHKCRAVFDRDINAARNIMLFALTRGLEGISEKQVGKVGYPHTMGSP